MGPMMVAGRVTVADRGAASAAAMAPLNWTVVSGTACEPSALLDMNISSNQGPLAAAPPVLVSE